MATKKAATSTKKAPARKSAPAKQTRTSVTTAPARATKNTLVGHVQDSIQSVALWRSLGAELVGTFLLASVVIAGQGQPIFVLFALAGIVLMIGAISGAHVNPAITIGAWVTRRIGWLRAISYIVVQLLGAALAYFVLSGFLAGAPAVDASSAALGQTAPALFKAADLALLVGKEWYLFFGEIVGTLILGFALANATREKTDRTAAAFTAGLGIFIALMVAVSSASYVSGTAIINPAIAISLQAYGATLWSFAIYAFAPIIGAVAGFILHDLLRGRSA
ncbi:MAG: aquaporin [Candidatus Microsaccharimonas sp.]